MTTIIKGIIFEDFINYKKPSMIIEMPFCDFKCDRDCGSRVCQNSDLAHAQDVTVDIEDIVNKYCNNPITEAIVFQGLEPFDSYPELEKWIFSFRQKTVDDIIIYTGYNKEEIMPYIQDLYVYGNIYIKYGRFIPNESPHYDPVLSVNLSSSNQYAERIS